jgi:hypothetical protein
LAVWVVGILGSLPSTPPPHTHPPPPPRTVRGAGGGGRDGRGSTLGRGSPGGEQASKALEYRLLVLTQATSGNAGY